MTTKITVNTAPPSAYPFRIDTEFWEELASSGSLYYTIFDENDPFLKALPKLLLEAYWASLLHEEGVYHSFSICFVEEDNQADHYELKEPISYEKSNLRKLIPSVGDIDVGFIVTHNDNNLVIIGITTKELCGSLIIKAIEPGCVICSYNGETVAVIERGAAYFFRDPELSKTDVIWCKLMMEPDSNSSKIVLDTLRLMRHLKRGGALFFVANLETVQSSIDSNIYAAKAPTTITANRIARFTSVDGATFMNNQLEIQSFGVKLKSGNDDNFTIQLIDPLYHDAAFQKVELDRFGGKRHQSAARFVHDNQETIAFVVSQDGEITCLLWQENARHAGVHAYKRLELTLF